MPTPQSPRQLSIKEAGALADIFVSDANYRNALNAPYTNANLPQKVVDEYHTHQETSELVLANTIKEVGLRTTPEAQKWQAGRNAVLALLSRQAIGSFEDYFLGPNSIPTISEAEPEMLPAGEYRVVGTNNRIVRYSNSIDNPLEFLDTSLSIIDRQKKLGPDSFGPENYATAMKLFSDKYSTLEHHQDEVDAETLKLPDTADVKELIDETLQGFFEVAARDTPNYLEMTNIFASIRALPKGVIDPKFTHDILLYTTKNIDQFDKRTSKVLLGAIAKIDTSEYPLESSAIVNLVLHSGGEFLTTRDLRTTVRAIDSLQKNPQTDAALKRFFELAEGFEQPLELEGIDEIIDRFNHILDEVTDDTVLAVQAKNFSHKCMARANNVARQMLASGHLTQAQMSQLRDTYSRIKANYQSL